jgi:hypothetical protein
MNKLPIFLLTAVFTLSVSTYLEVQRKEKPKPMDISVLQKEYDDCKKFWGDVTPSIVTDPCYSVLVNPKRYGREPRDAKAEKLVWSKSFI